MDIESNGSHDPMPAHEPGSILERFAVLGQYRPAVGNIADSLPVPPAPAGKRALSEVLAQLRDEETT